MQAPKSQSGPMTVEQFVAWAEQQMDRPHHELIDGQIVAMSPETLAHARRKAEIWDRLRTAIREAGLPCEAFVDGPGIGIDQHTVLIPDVMVHCGGGLVATQSVLGDPVIVVEVLSPSTRAIDMTHKLARYFRVPRVHHYLICRTDTPAILHHRRAADGIATAIVGSGALVLDPPGTTLQIDEESLPEPSAVP